MSNSSSEEEIFEPMPSDTKESPVTSAGTIAMAAPSTSLLPLPSAYEVSFKPKKADEEKQNIYSLLSSNSTVALQL